MDYFGITLELDCKYIGEITSKDLSKFTYLIKRETHRTSGSGATSYNRFTITDTKLRECAIELGDVKILDITDEYWWGLGSFNTEQAEFFFPSYQAPAHFLETSFSFFLDFLNWRISRQQGGGKFCFMAFQDAQGEIMRVPTSLSGSTEIENSIKKLPLLDYFKYNVTLKTYWTLLQLEHVGCSNTEQQTRLADFYNSRVRGWYHDSLQKNPQIHAEFPSIDEKFTELQRLVH
jgi:hypothetical protein